MRRQYKKKPTNQDLRAAGLTPELVARRVRSKEEFTKFVRGLVNEASNGNENSRTRGEVGS
jgi:hypothetical protein